MHAVAEDAVEGPLGLKPCIHIDLRDAPVTVAQHSTGIIQPHVIEVSVEIRVENRRKRPGNGIFLFLTVRKRKTSRKPRIYRLCETFYFLSVARYVLDFLVWEQIFLIFFIGTISFEVQKPNALCRSSVKVVLV